MILPICTYGNAVLRKVCEPLPSDYPNLKELIENMYETMYNASGVGLAAPQIGLSVRLLVIDLAPYKEDDVELGAFKATMINPQLLEASEETVTDEEGCLSVPGIHENVSRSVKIKISYLDENFNEHTEIFEGFKARVVQHEYDHIEGKIFTDKVSPLRRQLMKSKLMNMAKGKFSCSYRTK